MSSFVTPSAGSKHYGLKPKRRDDSSSSEDEWQFPSSEADQSIITNRQPSSSSNKRSDNNSKDPSAFFWNALRQRNLDFAINGECTSVCFSKSGHFLWAGFSDGTIRVFDLTGLFGGTTTWNDQADDDEGHKKKKKQSRMVSSKSHQSFGAVAAQIHARGVHTDLLTQVDIAGDDYVFGGVQRGAMELYAIDTSALEAEVAAALSSSQRHRPPTRNILDYLTVHVHSDAKLKGFGAAVALQTEEQQEEESNPKMSYLLLTGKGIKSIHIWKFQEPTTNTTEATWSQLYDCQTNGNTINLLSFYRNSLGQLWGVSQSDSQRLRLWDLSIEDKTPRTMTSSSPSSLSLLDDSTSSSRTTAEQRPRRPEYQDVQNSQAALAIGAGGFCVCGGPSMYNQLSIVSLDQPSSPYNHTELALPGTADQQDSGTASTLGVGGGRSSSRGGRQRRGDLKQVVRVSSLCQGVFHALLELDDGSIVHYKGSDPLEGGQSSHLNIVVPEATGIPPLPGDQWRRTMCLGFNRIVLSAVSMYNPHTQKGSLVVRALQDVPPPASPVAADPSALEMCMQVPMPKSKKKKKSGKKAGKRLVLATTSSPQVPRKGPSAGGGRKKDVTLSTSKPIVTARTSPVTMRHGSTATVVPPSSTKKTSTSNKRSSSTSKITPRLERRDMSRDLPPKISPYEAGPTMDVAREESVNNKPKKALRLYLDMQPKRVFNDTTETPVKRRRVESSLPDKPPARLSTSTQSNGRDASLVGSDKSPRRKRFENNRSEYPVRQLRSNATEGSLEEVASILVELKSPHAQSKHGKGHGLREPIPLSPASQRRIKTVKDKCLEFYEQLRRVFDSLSTDRTIDWNPVVKKHACEDRMVLLTSRHKAEHDAFKRRVTASTMTILYGIQNSEIAIEAARTQLQESRKSLMDILHDVVSRQELEIQVEISKQSLSADRQRYDESLRSVKSIFDTIDGICKILEPPKRLPGRPRGPVFELR